MYRSNNKDNLSVTSDLQFNADILNTVDALVLVLDQKGSIVFFNHLCEKVTGYSFKEVKGKYVWDMFLKKEEIDPVKEVFKKLSSGMFPNKHTNYWVTKSSRDIHVSWSNTAILDKNKTVKYIVPTGIVITDREKIESEIKEKVSELERFYQMAVSRELKMVNLKKEIVRLKYELSACSK